MSFTYYTGFPTPKDSLGTTQDKFFTNWQSVSDYLNVDHYDFGDALAGKHKWCTFPRQSVNFPVTTRTEIALFGQYDGANVQQLNFQPRSQESVNTNSVQMTSGNVTLPTFATNTAYDAGGVVAGRIGGWTFLPGKILYQYGSLTTAATSDTLRFPIDFAVIPFQILAIPFYSVSQPSSAASVYIDQGSITVQSFDWSIKGGNSNITGFYWQAIGKTV